MILTRSFNALPEKIFDAWTQPALLKKWFAPMPWTTSKAELDVRAGGTGLIVMCKPRGKRISRLRCVFRSCKNSRLVFTDAFTKAWEPSDKPFMLVELTFEAQAELTKYTSRVRHWSVVDREAHEKMGFHQGWVTCAEQLATLLE